MRIPIRRRIGALVTGLLGAMVAALGTVSGCRSGPEPGTQQRWVPLGQNFAASLPVQHPIIVTDIELGRRLRRDKRVARQVDRFDVRDTIYAIVFTSGEAANAILTATWTYHTGQLVDQTSQTVAPTGPAVTEFHVSRPTPWPAGSYQVEIFLDSASAGIRRFEIAR